MSLLMTPEPHSCSSLLGFNCILITAADGCLENAPDTADFSREFQKHQHIFDPEHDYPALAKWVRILTLFLFLAQIN